MTGIGMKRDPSEQRKPMKRGTFKNRRVGMDVAIGGGEEERPWYLSPYPKGIRKVSKKQARINRQLSKLKEILLNKQHELYGYTCCEVAHADLKQAKACMGALVLDHVLLRGKNVLNLAEMQILCEVHNGLKGSKRTDYRPAKMKDALAQEALKLNPRP